MFARCQSFRWILNGNGAPDDDRPYRRILSEQFHCFLLVIFVVNFWSERETFYEIQLEEIRKFEDERILNIFCLNVILRCLPLVSLNLICSMLTVCVFVLQIWCKYLRESVSWTDVANICFSANNNADFNKISIVLHRVYVERRGANGHTTPMQRTGNKNAAKRVDARKRGNDSEFRMNYYEIVDSTQNEISSNKLCIFDMRLH